MWNWLRARSSFSISRLRQIGPLKAVGKAELVSGVLDEIRVKGHLSVRMEADCDRCLEPADCPIDGDFELYYRPVTEGFGEEKALDAGEAEMGFYEGDGVELNDVLREFVLLSLPMQRLCRAGLQGNLSGVRAEPEFERVPLPGGSRRRPLGGAEEYSKLGR